MLSLKKSLKLKLKGFERLGILGVGSLLRGDDAAGMLVAQEIEASVKKLKNRSWCRVFFGETAPENLTGPIKAYAPTHLLIIDAFSMEKKPGSVSYFDIIDEVSSISFSTHKMPLTILTDYLKSSIGCSIGFIGIEPKSLKFASFPSPEIKKSAKLVAQAILEASKA